MDREPVRTLICLHCGYQPPRWDRLQRPHQCGECGEPLEREPLPAAAA